MQKMSNYMWPACVHSILKEPFHFSEMLTFNGLRAGELWIVCRAWAAAAAVCQKPDLKVQKQVGWGT